MDSSCKIGGMEEIPTVSLVNRKFRSQAPWWLGILLSASAVAQVPEIRANSIELGGFVGASYGIDT